jgi:Pyruvate/2-oxoacid:ferredoxin oxidoreductase delta subunit
MQWLIAWVFLFIICTLALWGHNHALTHSRGSEDIAQHLGRVTNSLVREPKFIRLIRHLLAFLEPYALFIGELGVRHFGRRGWFFRGPLKVVPLLLSWLAKRFFLSEVYTREEVENLMRNLSRKYTFTIASQGICPCRKALHKYSRTLPNACDFQILANSNLSPKIHPDYRQVSVEFVIRKVKEYDRIGLVHMMFGICGLEASEVAICNCHSSVCFPLRAAIVGLFPVIPAYHFMKVVPTKCDPACPVQVKCVKICPMRARQVDPDQKMRVNAKKCIGCGVCRNVCPIGANEMVDRRRKFHRILPRGLLEENVPVGQPVKGKGN